MSKEKGQKLITKLEMSVKKNIQRMEKRRRRYVANC